MGWEVFVNWFDMALKSLVLNNVDFRECFYELSSRECQDASLTVLVHIFQEYIQAHGLFIFPEVLDVIIYNQIKSLSCGIFYNRVMPSGRRRRGSISEVGTVFRSPTYLSVVTLLCSLCSMLFPLPYKLRRLEPRKEYWVADSSHVFLREGTGCKGIGLGCR